MIINWTPDENRCIECVSIGMVWERTMDMISAQPWT